MDTLEFINAAEDQDTTAAEQLDRHFQLELMRIPPQPNQARSLYLF